MFVILCDSFEDAQISFAEFLDFLETHESDYIQRVLEYAYTIDMTDGIRYVFTDYRFKNLFFNLDTGVCALASDEFFNDLEDYYINTGRSYIWDDN